MRWRPRLPSDGLLVGALGVLVRSVALVMGSGALVYLLASLTLDPTSRFAGRNPRPSDAAIAAVLDREGTNPQVPLLTRTVGWLGRVVQGDLGVDAAGNPLTAEVLGRAAVSAQLLCAGAVLGAVLGILLGVWAAARRNRTADHAVAAFTTLVLATPGYVLGGLLMLAAMWVNAALGTTAIRFTGQYTPGVTDTTAVLADRIGHLLLPTIALGMTGAAGYARYQRAAMLDVLQADYLRTARAKGCTRRQALWRHGVRVALIPMVTYLAYTFGLLLAGSTFLELVFGWHGIGELAVTAIPAQDVNAVAAVAVYLAVLVTLASLLSRFLHLVMDPRARPQ